MIKKIEKLKKERDAVILAHYYVEKEIQDIADYVGDSFYLAKKATTLDNDVIVMAGVYFMGESIKVLNPDKKVFMVDIEAGCPMVDMVTVEEIESMREEYEDLAVVTYINSTAETKAHSDLVVTSSNALNLVSQLEEKNIFFIPDANLGKYLETQIKEKNFIFNEGHCPVHNRVDGYDIDEIKFKYPEAKILAHPESKMEVLDRADYIGSTSGIIEETNKEGDEFIIVTEKGINTALKKANPDKNFYIFEDFICRDMKYPNLEKLIDVLENKENEIFVDEDLAKKALIPLERMLELSK